MSKGRLEAFSDGVFAIVLTIMVLELKAPRGTDLEALRPLVPAFLSYALSFVYIGIYWNNHHHVFQAVERVDGVVLWANLHLLFWLSLISFITSWMGESAFSTWSVIAYGIVLFLCAVAWEVERRSLLRLHAPGSALFEAMSRNSKEWVSLGLYAVGIGLAFVNVWVASALYCVVAGMWLVPDRRIERQIGVADARGERGE